MIGPYETSRLLEFQKRFPDNEACVTHMASRRWPDGFICSRCGHTEAWYHTGRGLFDCKGCRFQTSVTSGTIIHGTRLPLVKWYQALYLMATGDARISTADIQRLLDIRQYRTAWAMGQKIQKAAAERDSRYHLSGLVELDSAFFITSPDGRQKAGKNIAIFCAVSLYHDCSGHDQPGVAWMQIVENPSMETVRAFLDRLRYGTAGREKEDLLKAIRARGWQAHGKVSSAASLPYYRVVIANPRHDEVLLSWIHRLVSATKTVVTESPPNRLLKHRRAYLAELCHRFNRKFMERELFNRLVETLVVPPPPSTPGPMLTPPEAT